jgi:hypothetical protein
MAITLRNKKVEEDIREIGRHTGEGPSAVIARAVAAERARIETERKQRKEERLAQIRAFTSTLPVFTDEERAAMLREQDSLYDYLYDAEAAGERSDGEDEPGA